MLSLVKNLFYSAALLCQKWQQFFPHFIFFCHYLLYYNLLYQLIIELLVLSCALPLSDTNFCRNIHCIHYWRWNSCPKSLFFLTQAKNLKNLRSKQVCDYQNFWRHFPHNITYSYAMLLCCFLMCFSSTISYSSPFDVINSFQYCFSQMCFRFLFFVWKLILIVVSEYK